MLSSDILSPEEGLVWIFFFPQIQHFLYLKTFPLSSKCALTVPAELLMLVLFPFGGEKKNQNQQVEDKDVESCLIFVLLYLLCIGSLVQGQSSFLATASCTVGS